MVITKRRLGRSLVLFGFLGATASLSAGEASAAPSSCSSGFNQAHGISVAGGWVKCTSGTGLYRAVAQCYGRSTYSVYGPWEAPDTRPYTESGVYCDGFDAISGLRKDVYHGGA